MNPEEVTFSESELRVIARLAQNLLSCAVEAELDPGVLETIYYKTQDFLD
jgi:hypothetical protein